MKYSKRKRQSYIRTLNEFHRMKQQKANFQGLEIADR